MNFLIDAFNIFLYRPLFNALVLLYDYLPGHDFGLAIIILTIIIRIVLYPLMVQSIKSQKVLSELQPKIQEIQRKYSDDKEKQAKETMELYKKEKINPFGGCLPLLIQFPLLIALYQVFWKGIQQIQQKEVAILYNFVPHPGSVDPTFFGLIDLSKPCTIATAEGLQFVWINIILIVIVGITQFIQTKMITPKTANIKNKGDQMSQFSNIMQKQMIYFLPIFTVFILWRLPAAVSLYWLVTSLFSIFQQYLIYRTKEPALLQRKQYLDSK